MSVFNKLGHLAIDKCEKQGADMASIHIGIRHDNNFVIPQFCDIKFIFSNARAQSTYECTNFLRSKHAVKAGALHIQNFTSNGKNRLVFTVTTCFSIPSGTVSFHDKELG